MFRAFVLAVAFASLTSGALGCSTKDPNTAADAKSDQSPVDELRAVTDDLGKDVDAIMRPINDVDDVLQKLDDLPKKYGMKASDLKAMAKASLDGGDVTITANVPAEAKDDVTALLTKIKGIGTGIAATPDKVQALLTKLPASLAKVPALYAKAQGSLTVKANSPFGSADEKAKAKADLADLDKLKTDVMAKIDKIKSDVTGLPDRATQALAKLKSALG